MQIPFIDQYTYIVLFALEVSDDLDDITVNSGIVYIYIYIASSQ